MDKKKYCKLQISVSKEQMNWLNETARKRGGTITEIVRGILWEAKEKKEGISK